MSGKCTICSHPQRAEIDKAIVSQMSLRNIAKQFDVGYQSVKRHRDKHLPVALQEAKEASEAEAGLSVFDQLRSLQRKTLKILAAAEKEGTLNICLIAIREARQNVELECKMMVASGRREGSSWTDSVIQHYQMRKAAAGSMVQRTHLRRVPDEIQEAPKEKEPERTITPPLEELTPEIPNEEVREEPMKEKEGKRCKYCGTAEGLQYIFPPDPGFYACRKCAAAHWMEISVLQDDWYED